MSRFRDSSLLLNALSANVSLREVDDVLEDADGLEEDEPGEEVEEVAEALDDRDFF